MKSAFVALAFGALVTAPACAQVLAAPEDATGPEATGPQDTPIEGIAAVVNDEPISYSDVRERARMLLLGLETQIDEATLQRITGEAREQLIDERLQLQKAAEYEVDVSVEDIRAEIAEMAAGFNVDLETFYQQLRASGVNPTSLEEQTRAQIAWRRIMQGLYGRNIRISANQIDDRLDVLKSGQQTTQYNLSEIFLYAPRGTDRRQEAVEFAATLVEQLEKGLDFANAARRFSAAATAATGGQMGWVSVNELAPELREVVSSMEATGYTQPIEVDAGIYILGVAGRQLPAEKSVRYDLKQLLSPTSDTEALNRVISGTADCEELPERVEAEPDVTLIDIGSTDIATLSEENRARIQATPVGEASEIFTVRNGLAVSFVCAIEETGGELPTRIQIENQLYGQQLGMISDRELRDLKRESLIIRR